MSTSCDSAIVYSVTMCNGVTGRVNVTRHLRDSDGRSQTAISSLQQTFRVLLGDHKLLQLVQFSLFLCDLIADYDQKTREE